MKKLFNVFAPLIFIIIFIAMLFTHHLFLSIIIAAALYFFLRELIWFFSAETDQKSVAGGPGELSPLGYSTGVYARFSGCTVEFFEEGKSVAFWRRDRTGSVVSREGREIYAAIIILAEPSGQKCI